MFNLTVMGRPVFAGALILLFSFVSLGATSASADITQRIDFTFNSQQAAPQNPVSGSITITADDANFNQPTSIVSIDLNIAGHQYAVGEVGFVAAGAMTATIGGLVNGPEIVSASTEDFSITYNSSTGAPSFFPFGYATPATGSVWSSVAPVPEFTITTLSSATVPAIGPIGAGVLISALAAVALRRLKHRKQPIM